MAKKVKKGDALPTKRQGEKPIQYRVPDEVRRQSIETLKVDDDVLEYLRERGIKTIGETIPLQDEFPTHVVGQVNGCIIFGIDWRKKA